VLLALKTVLLARQQLSAVSIFLLAPTSPPRRFGARIQARLPDALLRRLIGVLVTAIGVRYL
jgi:uncharacterized membrane protein YfcA